VPGLASALGYGTAGIATQGSAFREASFAAWVGLIVVCQNFFSSLLNSHLFDFHEGWMYVLGVGVAGGVCQSAGKVRQSLGAES
jgi:hypothetical protein